MGLIQVINRAIGRSSHKHDEELCRDIVEPVGNFKIYEVSLHGSMSTCIKRQLKYISGKSHSETTGIRSTKGVGNISSSEEVVKPSSSTEELSEASQAARDRSLLRDRATRLYTSGLVAIHPHPAHDNAISDESNIFKYETKSPLPCQLEKRSLIRNNTCPSPATSIPSPLRAGRSFSLPLISSKNNDKSSTTRCESQPPVLHPQASATQEEWLICVQPRRAHRVRFCDVVRIHDAYECDVYDRRPELMGRDSHFSAIEVYRELMRFKLTEMRIHKDSHHNTNLHMSQGKNYHIRLSELRAILIERADLYAD